MVNQGRPRLFCSETCRVWQHHHRGQRRQRTTDLERSRTALEAWSSGTWEQSCQPWSWPIDWRTRAQAAELLATT